MGTKRPAKRPRRRSATHAEAPPKNLAREVEGLQAENEELRATNERLKRLLQELTETQRDLASKHAALEDAVRRLTGDE